MNKTATIAAIILLMLPLLCCSKDQPIKQIEKKAEEIERVEEKSAENLETEPDTFYDALSAEFNAGFKASGIKANEKMDMIDADFKRKNKSFDAMIKAKYKVVEDEFNEKWNLTFVEYKSKAPGLKTAEENGKLNGALSRARREALSIKGHKTLEIKYEEKFKKEAPKWKKHSAAHLLTRAIELNLPYLTKEEELNLKMEDEKIKTEYKKRFGVPITDAELSTTRIDFIIIDMLHGHTYLNIIVARTMTGVLAKYRRNEGKVLELKLDIGEWLDFIHAIYKCGINELKKECSDPSINVWELSVFSLDREVLVFFGDNDDSCRSSNWNEFKKIIDDMDSKIIQKAGVK